MLSFWIKFTCVFTLHPSLHPRLHLFNLPEVSEASEAGAAWHHFYIKPICWDLHKRWWLTKLWARVEWGRSMSVQTRNILLISQWEKCKIKADPLAKACTLVYCSSSVTVSVYQNKSIISSYFLRRMFPTWTKIRLQPGFWMDIHSE